MATQFYIDTTGFKCAAVDAGLTYEYQNGERTDRLAGRSSRLRSLTGASRSSA